MSSARQFWETQTDSRHRHGSPAFYRDKADEHAGVMWPADRELPAIDLGCGAGELVNYLKHLIRLDCGLDYAESMLAKARHLNPDVTFVQADFEDFVASCSQPVWLATGSVNQYVDPDGQRRILDHFVANPESRAIYWFDNVDPIRYIVTSRVRLLDYESGAPVSRVRLLLALARLAGRGLLLPRRLDVMHLSLRMGYAYRPAFWIREGSARGLSVQVVSSRYYEYRYHLIIHKG